MYEVTIEQDYGEYVARIAVGREIFEGRGNTLRQVLRDLAREIKVEQEVQEEEDDQ